MGKHGDRYHAPMPSITGSSEKLIGFLIISNKSNDKHFLIAIMAKKQFILTMPNQVNLLPHCTLLHRVKYYAFTNAALPMIIRYRCNGW